MTGAVERLNTNLADFWGGPSERSEPRPAGAGQPDRRPAGAAAGPADGVAGPTESDGVAEEVIESALTVTVTDAATVFDGPDNIYRYDLPASGITEGWAVPAVVDQARQLYPETWPEVEVIVDATEPAAETLVRAFVAHGAGAYPAGVLREHALPAPAEPAEPAEPPGPRAGRQSGGFGLFHLLLLAVVLAVAAVSWWAIGATTAPDAVGARPGAGAEGGAVREGGAVAGGRAGSPQRSGAGTDGLRADPGGAEEAGEEVENVVVHELGAVRLETPPGFTAEATDDAWLLRGPDEALRVHVAADALHGVAASRVMEQVRHTVSGDPVLEPASAPPVVAARGEVVAYRELPGDGSETTWTTWVDGHSQLSVGCQTRSAPSATQQAACGIVVESLHTAAVA